MVCRSRGFLVLTVRGLGFRVLGFGFRVLVLGSKSMIEFSLSLQICILGFEYVCILSCTWRIVGRSK